MSHQAFWDAIHDAKVRMDEERAALDDRDDDEGDELAEREDDPGEELAYWDERL